MSQINNLSYHFKKLEKANRRKQLIKIKAESMKLETKIIKKNNETKNWLFEKINKIDKPLERLIRKEDTNQ